MLRQAVRLNSLTEIALTKLDVLDGFDTVRICTGYELDGELLPGYPDRSAVLGSVVPRYVDMPGWQTSIRAAAAFADLPVEAQAFVECVEAEVGVPVRIVGTGPERDEFVVRDGETTT